jgi:hypothetical protein
MRRTSVVAQALKRSATRVRPLALVAVLAAPFLAGALSGVFAQQARVDASVYSSLRWRLIGPFRGGRVNGVTGVPG